MNCSSSICRTRPNDGRSFRFNSRSGSATRPDFDLEAAATAAKGYSGAEIDAAVQGAMYAAYSEKKPLTTQLLLNALAQTVPLSTTRAEEINELRQWAQTRAVPASARDAAPKHRMSLWISSH